MGVPVQPRRDMQAGTARSGKLRFLTVRGLQAESAGGMPRGKRVTLIWDGENRGVRVENKGKAMNDAGIAV